MQTSKLMAAAIVSLFVVGACGGTGGTPTSAPVTTTPAGGTADPCTLLTQADIKSATGVDYGQSVADSYGSCRWFFGTSTVDEGKGMVTVSFASTGTTLASIKSGPFGGGVDLTVSGHPAYWYGGDVQPGIWVDLGASVLVVGINPVPAGGQAIAQHLAEFAVAKL